MLTIKSQLLKIKDFFMFKILFLMLFAFATQFCNAGYDGLKQPIRGDGESQSRINFFANITQEPETDYKPDHSKIIVENINGNRNFKIKNTDDQEFNAGYFEQITLGKLRKEAPVFSNRQDNGPIKLTIMYAQENRRTVDIGALQADPKNIDAVFQVASNFNALESTYHTELPRLVDYIHDYTQGPFASISAAPGLILRQYYCFWEKFTNTPNKWPMQKQNEGKISSDSHINLLERLGVTTQNGYIVSDIENITPENFNNFKIGFHSNIQVTSGLAQGDQHQTFYDPNQLINQVFAAAINMGQYRDAEEQAKLILKWTYEATLKAAFCKGKKRVFLTRMGGGAFGNDPRWIEDAIIEAIKDPFLANSGLEVILNNFTDEPSIFLKTYASKIILDGEVIFGEKSESEKNSRCIIS